MRRPRFVASYYLHSSAVAQSLIAARDRYLAGRGNSSQRGLRGHAYYPIFEPVARDYAGADVALGPRVRYVGPVEELAVLAASFVLVLCTQVLEHVSDPPQALAQIARVLRPGGHAFVTTHGVSPFHPYPVDRLRWTQRGLETAFVPAPGLTLVRARAASSHGVVPRPARHHVDRAHHRHHGRDEHRHRRVLTTRATSSRRSFRRAGGSSTRNSEADRAGHLSGSRPWCPV